MNAKDLATVQAGIKDGSIDIVVGTHALLGKGIEFARLGLIVVDEEQHFGVGHKERLKQLRTRTRSWSDVRPRRRRILAATPRGSR